MKKLLSLLLVLAMLAALPVTAGAAEESGFSSFAQLKELAAGSYSSLVYTRYTGTEPLTVTEDLTLPKNLFVIMPYGCGELTVAAGVSLTVEQALQLSAPATVNGSLVNNGAITIFPDDDQEWSNGSLSFSGGGAYFGTGIVRIFSNTVLTPELAVPGLDLSGFEVKNLNDSVQYAYCWELRDVSGLTRLAAPAYLEWGYNHDAADEGSSVCPGYISWQPVNPTQGHALVRVYRGDTGTLCCEEDLHYGASNVPDWRSIDSFLRSDPESGVYYFTVTSLGDYITYADSQTVESELWIYEKPAEKTASCVSPVWNWPQVSYAAPDAMLHVAGYEVEFWYSPDTEAAPYPVASEWTRNMAQAFTPEVSDQTLQECGSGYYSFRVRTLSADITQCANGAWSALSDAYHYTTQSDVPTDPTEPSDPVLPDIILGDANGDGRVNFKDAILVLQFASSRITEADLNVAAADVNGDGRHNFKDAILMLQIASGRA